MKLEFMKNGYDEDLKEYSDNVLVKCGTSSKSAERETICLAQAGNTVAQNFYADMIYNKKILRKKPYSDAFYLYMQAAGISVDASGEWKCSGKANPLAFWSVGYYLVNYKRENVLLKCDTITEIEALSMDKRLSMALEFAAASISYEEIPGAVNLIGRILSEASKSDDLFETLKPVIAECLVGHEIPESSEVIESCDDHEKCAEISESFFVAAAKLGYVYACNSLAAKEADRIVAGVKDGSGSDKLVENIINYICYLRIAADRLEPYAANRLGLFYMNGEIKGNGGTVTFKEYVDHALAYEYFKKATVYPDANSAWAYLNLMKYFHKDYDLNIDLMNEHMDYIKTLSREVYDIAMDL
ncbi:MAG: hypothetical protein J5684_01230 [Eubacterium sp.]|nr:hypothetical protein [Eubacterium sp.]